MRNPVDDEASPMTTDRMDPNDPWLARRTFVAPDARLVYVETPKAACTSIKHALESLVGRAVRTGPSDKPETSRAMTIHDRSSVRFPSVADLPRAQRLEILGGSSDWFVFAVTRNPVDRLVSAWAGKVLLADPLGVRLDLEDTVVTCEQRIDLAKSFERFVERFEASVDIVALDPHFMPQTKLLRPHLMPYDVLLPTYELDAVMGAANEHLAKRGLGPLPPLERFNEGVQVRWSQVASDAVRDRIARIYEDDFDVFSFDMPRASANADYSLLSPLESTLVREVRARNERIADLSRLARSRRGLKYGIGEVGRELRERTKRLVSAQRGTRDE